MATELALVNRALHLLGQEPVADLGESARQGSAALVKVLRSLESARDTVLRRHGWTCALEYASLSPVVLPGYANARYPGVYQLPGGALKVWEIEGARECDWGPRWQAGTFEAGGGAAVAIIRASDATGPLTVAYVRTAAWAALDAHLADAVAVEMAAQAAYSVTGDAELQGRLEKKAEQRLLLAIAEDGDQEGGQPELAVSIPAQLRNMAR